MSVRPIRTHYAVSGADVGVVAAYVRITAVHQVHRMAVFVPNRSAYLIVNLELEVCR